MVRYHGADVQVGDCHIGSGNNKIESVSSIVSGFRHVLYVSERLQKLVQSCGVDIFDLVDVYVKVAAIYNISAENIWRQRFEQLMSPCRNCPEYSKAHLTLQSNRPVPDNELLTLKVVNLLTV